MLFCVTKVVFGWILNLSMEEEEENRRKRKGKFRSCWRKKRKGFHGKKAWEMRRETSTDANHDAIPNAIEESCKHRQPKRTICGFGLQRSFGRNILELLVYYLMPNKCKKS